LASPIAFRGKTPAEDRVLLQSPDRITAHDPATGGETWNFKAECSGIPSAVAVDGVVYVPAEGVVALEPPTSGGEPTVKWKAAGVQPGAASPLVGDGRLFAVNRAGVLNCVDIKSGEAAWKVRLQGSFWSSPILVGNRLYCFNQEGLAQVVEISADGKKGQVVGKADFGEGIQSSPAVADGALYVRSDRHLWKIQKDAGAK
jgi:outer membrane protein assembly factor BamB